MVRETDLTPARLILPCFVQEGRQAPTPVTSMPGVARQNSESILKVAEDCVRWGIPAMAIFPVVDPSRKSKTAKEAFADKGLVQTVIRAVKKRFPELGVISDIALDPYTLDGQDGLTDKDGYVMNDETVAVLCRQAVSHAAAGADVVAPSDMMDGRVGAIRAALDKEAAIHTQILAYTAKYASAFYGPFRDAVGSKKALGGGSKDQYQMDPGNGDEAIAEAALDVSEGADMIMVKPALPYLDIVHRLSEKFALPVFAYQVSGEYAMIKAAHAQGWIDGDRCMMETLLSIRRAGARAILSYAALDIAKVLKQNAGPKS